MQKDNNLTVGQWCGQWFTANRHKWNGNTECGYRNLIYSHIFPNIGSVAISDLTEQTVTDFYDVLRSQGLSGKFDGYRVFSLLRENRSIKAFRHGDRKSPARGRIHPNLCNRYVSVHLHQEWCRIWHFSELSN